MKYILILAIIFWILFRWAKYSADHGPIDDFGAALPALFAGAVAIVFTAVYVALVFWYHAFW